MQGSSHQPQNSQQQKCCGWSQAVTNNNAALKKEKEKKRNTCHTIVNGGLWAPTPYRKDSRWQITTTGVTVQQLPTRLNRAPIESIKTVPVGLVGRDGRDTGGEKGKTVSTWARPPLTDVQPSFFLLSATAANQRNDASKGLAARNSHRPVAC